MKTRITSLLILAALASSSLLSCQNTPAPDNSNDSDQTDSVDTSSTEAVTTEVSGVPNDLDLDGETISVWYTTLATSVAESFVDLNPEQTGEVLDDAIYQMNHKVEEKLNCTFDFYNSGVPTSDTGSEVRKLLLSDDTTYDLFHVVQWNSAVLASEGIYKNMYDAPYLSLDKPWWDNFYMNEMVVGENKLYALVGDYAVDRTRCLDCIYYNKDMYEDYYGDPDELYDVVLDGKWTIDRMQKIAAEAYVDLNNNDIVDLDDRLGYTVNADGNLDALFYGFNARVTERDKDNLPVFVINNEQTANICQRIYSFCYESTGAYFYKAGTNYSLEVDARVNFEEGDSMFFIGFLYTSEFMREMKANFGIIPVPKYDENQENYVSDVHDIMRFYVVPSNCQKVDSVCAALEELSYEGYMNMLPKYYDVVLKNKYARDAKSAQMIDIIRNSCKPEFAHIYGSACNNLGYIARELMVAGSADFASQYAKKESAAKSGLSKFIDQFLSVGD